MDIIIFLLLLGVFRLAGKWKQEVKIFMDLMSIRLYFIKEIQL